MPKAPSEACLGPARYLINNAGPVSASDIPFELGVLAGVGSVRRVTEAWSTAAGPSPSNRRVSAQ